MCLKALFIYNKNTCGSAPPGMAEKHIYKYLHDKKVYADLSLTQIDERKGGY